MPIETAKRVSEHTRLFLLRSINCFFAIVKAKPLKSGHVDE